MGTRSFKRLSLNPGGQIPQDEVIGRRDFIMDCWTQLQQSSVILTAERRMGKTVILKSMEREEVRGLVLFQDLEKIHSPDELVRSLSSRLRQHVGLGSVIEGRVQNFLRVYPGLEAAGVKAPELRIAWKDVLVELLEEVLKRDQAPLRLFWDEFPLMLHNLAVRGEDGVRDARELLDVLRYLRQTWPQLRFVFTGSVGLHLVMALLEGPGYANRPFNDVTLVEVPPLSPDHAVELAGGLMTGEHIHCLDLEGTAQAVAIAVEGMPFYIHHVVKKLKALKRSVTLADVEQVTSAALVDTLDPWDLNYVHKRLEVYYEEGRRRRAQTLLDELASSDGPASLRQLVAAMKPHDHRVDIDAVRELTLLLARDHYLEREQDGRYRFRYGLIRRFWAMSRGL